MLDSPLYMYTVALLKISQGICGGYGAKPGLNLWRYDLSESLVK